MRIHLPVALIVVAIYGPLFVTPAPAQDAPAAAKADVGVVIGLVTDRGKQRLPGVTLTIKTAAGNRLVVSDAQGRYRLAGLPLGVHRVVADLPGFLPTVREVELTSRYPEADASFMMQIGEVEETITIPLPLSRFRVVPLEAGSR
jgi:hypothetical protein